MEENKNPENSVVTTEKKQLFYAEDLKIGVAAIKEKEIGNVKKREAYLFLKVDPRIVMDAMDKKFGEDNWDKETTIVSFGNNSKTCKCTIKVYKENDRVVSRSDYSSTALWAGPNEYKVMDSDAFRRTAMNFGIGRELYSFDNIVVEEFDDKGNKLLEIKEIDVIEDGFAVKKLICTDEFYVEQLKYEDGRIVALSIKTTSGKRVFCENRENTRLQGTIIDGNNNNPQLAEAKAVKVGFGSKADECLGNLEKYQLLWVFSNTKDAIVKQSCLIVAKANPETKHFFVSRGINL